MTKPAPFNPLFDTAQQATQKSESAADRQMEGGKPMTALAAIYNQTQGQCPKCKQQMTTAILANNDPAFFCERCCVTMPLSDA